MAPGPALPSPGMIPLVYNEVCLVIVQRLKLSPKNKEMEKSQDILETFFGCVCEKYIYTHTHKNKGQSCSHLISL